MSTLEFDDEATRHLLAVYITPDIAAQRQEFLEAFGPQRGEDVLDVGAGPGFLAMAIAEAVGETGSVCGLDISESLLEFARSQNGGRYNIDYRQGDATRLPWPDDSFDSLVSTQVLEYIPDVDAALAEFHRVLRVGGRVALLDTDWDSIVWNSPDRARMKRILKAWEDHASDPFLPRSLGRRLRSAGFQIEAHSVIPLLNPEFDSNTYSNRMIDLIKQFVIDREGISREDADTWADEVREFGMTGDYFFSLNRYLFVARKP